MREKQLRMVLLVVSGSLASWKIGKALSKIPLKGGKPQEHTKVAQ